jgi:16S rRNA (cytidine1402-2'-O)-methyltransferase
MHKPALLLLPNLLGDHRHHELFLPESVAKAMQTIDGLICESEKAGRRYLSRFETKKEASEIPIAIYNEHTPDEDVDFFLEPIRKGERWGLISDGGLPCIADPGAKIVRRARQSGIMVQAFVGPSSILMALMQSGLSGQRFTFHGYIKADEAGRLKDIKRLEGLSKAENSTQIFIEAPYRNMHMLQGLLNTLDDNTWLCVAWELTMPEQGIISEPVSRWKKMPLPNLEKKAATFLINAGLKA